MADSSPFSHVLERYVPPVGTAGNDQDTPVDQAPFDGTVSSVQYVPAATITGANTNTRSVTLFNKGQAGAGTTTVATLQFDSGVNATADDEKTITLSGTPANLTVAAGDTLLWRSLHVGTGITDPGGLVRITITRTYA
jgi:hypothetical protein